MIKTSLSKVKKKYFSLFLGKKVFKKICMAINIGVIDGVEYGGIVYFQFKLL